MSLSLVPLCVIETYLFFSCERLVYFSTAVQGIRTPKPHPIYLERTRTDTPCSIVHFNRATVGTKNVQNDA